MREKSALDKMLSQCLILQAHREFIVFDPHVFPRSSRERERESEILFGENFSIKVLWNRQVDGQQREHHSRDENFAFIGKSIKEWTYKKLGGSVHIIKQILSDRMFIWIHSKYDAEIRS